MHPSPSHSFEGPPNIPGDEPGRPGPLPRCCRAGTKSCEDDSRSSGMSGCRRLPLHRRYRVQHPGHQGGQERRRGQGRKRGGPQVGPLLLRQDRGPSPAGGEKGRPGRRAEGGPELGGEPHRREDRGPGGHRRDHRVRPGRSHRSAGRSCSGSGALLSRGCRLRRVRPAFYGKRMEVGLRGRGRIVHHHRSSQDGDEHRPWRRSSLQRRPIPGYAGRLCTLSHEQQTDSLDRHEKRRVCCGHLGGDDPSGQRGLHQDR